MYPLLLSNLAKLSAGDMIAREACYHKDCMSQFSNKYRNDINKASKTKKDHQQNLESIALAQTILFIEEARQHNTEEVAPFIKLSDVRKFYQTCLKDLNTS